LNKVGDPSVSPYLLQRLRSQDEVQDDRAQRRRETDPAIKPAPETPPAKSSNPGETPRGSGVDRKV
jgi:hypothetical protein